MKILYVVKTFSVVEPVGVLQLSAVTRRQGHESFIAAIDDGKVEELVASRKIDVVAFSCLSTEARAFLELARRLRARYPRLTIVAGGPHPTYFPQIIETWPLDAVVVGEGEWAMADLMTALSRGQAIDAIANIHSRRQRNPLRPLIEDLDTLPFADRDLIRDLSPFKYVRMKSFFATRGCPYQCAYCFNSAYRRLYQGKGPALRRRSVDHLLREIEQERAAGPLEFVRFGDDAFVVGEDAWLEEFCAQYPRRIGRPFYLLINPGIVTRPLMQRLKDAGCYSLMMGIETGDEQVRRELLHRPVSDQALRQAFAICRDLDIKVFSNTILGLPGSDLAADLRSVDLTLDCRPTYAGFTVFTPFPGTELYEYSLRHGYLDPAARFEDAFPASMQQGSCLKDVPPARQRVHKNLLLLAPVANWRPALRRLMIQRLIYWPPNIFFVMIGFLVRNYLNARIWPFRKSPRAFGALVMRVIAIDRKNYAARVPAKGAASEFS